MALSRQRLTEGEGSEKRWDRWTCAWGRALEVTLQQFSMSGRSIARSFDQLDDQNFVLDLVASDKRDSTMVCSAPWAALSAENGSWVVRPHGALEFESPIFSRPRKRLELG